MTEDRRTPTALEPAWNVRLRDIPEAGLDVQREATAEERAELARTLELLSVPRFRANYRIRPAGGGRYGLRGKLEATVEQTCGVTLKPVLGEVRADLEASFWPQDDLDAPASGAVDIEDEPDPEPIVDSQLEIGRVLFETFATGIDPFPRAPDAELDWKPPADGAGTISPFAKLSRLKK